MEMKQRVRRRFSVEQKRQILAEALKPGQSMATVGRKYNIKPTQLYRWRTAMNEAIDTGLKHSEKVYSEREVKELKDRVALLEKTLGKQTVSLEILEEAVRIGVEKKLISPKYLSKLRGGR